MSIIKKVGTFILGICLTMSLTVTASPYKMTKNSSSNTDDLVKITNIKDYDFTTSKSAFIIKGSADEDTEMSIYRLEDGLYVKYSNSDDSYDWNIGASRIFVKQINLEQGINKICVLAKNGSKKQIIKITVRVKNSDNLFNKDIKNFTELLTYNSGN